MSFRSMEQGIKAIQQGNHAEGARMLRVALKSPQLQGSMRAIAYLWLAETVSDPREKLKYYDEALTADPGNEHAQQRKSAVLAMDLPPQQNTPPGGMPAAPQPPNNQQNTPPYGSPIYSSGNTPAQGMPPQRDPNLPGNQQYGTPPPEGVPPYGDPTRNPARGDNTPPQGTPTYTPNDPRNRPYGDTPGNTPPGGVPSRNQQQPYGNTPPQGMPAYRTGNPTPNTDTPPQGVPPSYSPGGLGQFNQQNSYVQQQQQFYRTVGIRNGPNGPGTGFFVTQDGIIATTRFVIGGEQEIQIELDQGRIVDGEVIRAYPELDLALVRTGVQVSQLLPPSQSREVPESIPLTAIAHSGTVMNGRRRSTQSAIKPDWFPTTIAEMGDSGGNPIFDDRNLLVGMLTNNANRSSAYVYGLKIQTIYQQVGQYLQENSTGERRAYCNSCGHRSRAGGAGAFYCEVCGSTLPHAQNVRRYQLPQMAVFYDENSRTACPNCGSRAGYYNNQCLRCGYDLRQQRGR